MNDPRRQKGLRLERARASAQFKDGRFVNPSGATPDLEGSSLPLLGEFFFRGGRRTPKGPLPVSRPHEAWARPSETGLRVTWLGHSTVLLELDGRRVLTDPVFGERVSPVSFAGPKRFHPVPAGLDELPPLDAVLLSHDHFDHLCAPTVAALARTRVPIVTALGVGAHLEELGVDPERITELDWHEHIEVGGVRFTATPAQHFSGRGLTSRNRTLWASWVVETERRKVFFSGDTGLTPAFADVGRTHGPFDLVMLEVGAYHPAWGAIHLGPENALAAFEMLGGGTLLPVHWGTFNLALHDWDDPAETLLSLATERRLRIVTPQIGAVFEPEHVDAPTPWWRAVDGARERVG
ncbi:MBL fold metallo-hydrolase [Polyangium spumosum]|uniref:MBL fold metallo-hydrolase n=1 Tax=Polyangium spumosum TaxID=889282 RepID=UPI0030846C7B